MQAIITTILEKFDHAVQKAYPEVNQFQEKPVLEVTQSTQEKFGHYQFNGAMKLAKTLKLNPRQVAEAIIKELDLQKDGLPFIEKTEIAGPGFVNITLDSKFLSHALENVALVQHQ